MDFTEIRAVRPSYFRGLCILGLRPLSLPTKNEKSIMIVRTNSEVYLDANATTQVLPEAAKAARDVMEDLYGNPSSSHIAGLRARNILESTRDLARKILGAASGQIVFTSGATEAIQMAVLSALYNAKEQRAAGNLSLIHI